MKLVLREDVEHLGSRGEIVNVAPGYARNYLLPKRLAYEATPGNLKMIAAQRRAWEARAQRDAEEAQALAERFGAVRLSVTKKSGEADTLYGSVTTSEIAELLAGHGFEVDRRKIQLTEPIKTLGEHTVSIKLFREIHAKVTVEVLSENPRPEKSSDGSTDETVAPAEPAEPAESVEA